MRVVILVCDTSSWPVLHNCEASWLYSKRFSSYGADMKLRLKPSRGNNSESMTARVVILIRNTSSWPVLHNCEVSWLYFKGYSSYGADTKLHLEWSRGNNSEIWQQELPFLYATHHHDLFNIIIKYHRNIPNGFQVKERTQNCIWNNQREITTKVWRGELSFLYATNRHDLFYITVKYHDYIPNGFQVMERTQICTWNHQVILVRDTSSWPVLHNCEVSWLYSKGHPSYRADTNMHKKASTGR